LAATIFDLEIWIDNQEEPTVVRADQRDMAAFELEYKIGTSRALDEMQMVFFRYLGWHAMRRTGKIDVSIGRDKWLENVYSVEPLDDEEPLDPTSPAA
jgi:hypothetical protein